QHWRGKVPALRRIRVGLEPAQSEHLQASERSLWVRQAVRGLLAKSAAEAARFIAERGGVAEGVHVGLPAISPRRAAKLGWSSVATAACNALRSSSCITTGNLFIGEVVPLAAAVSDAPPTGYVPAMSSPFGVVLDMACG